MTATLQTGLEKTAAQLKIRIIHGEAGLVGSGVEAKVVIQDGEVKVNGEVDVRRGRKLHPGDCFEFEGNEVKVTSV